MANDDRRNVNNADDAIMIYLKVLLEKKGMSSLPPEILAGMLMDLYGRFEGFLLVNVMREMDEETSKKFDEFLKTNPTPQESMFFLRENFENIQDVVKKSMFEFEKIYLEG